MIEVQQQPWTGDEALLASGANTHHFQGWIDDVRIYADVALDSDEAQTLATGDLHAAAAVQPTALAAYWTMDGQSDQNIEYTYDNTVQTGKTTRTGADVGQGTILEDVDYTYNVQGRLSAIDDGDTVTTYTYDDNSIRVSQDVDGLTTLFLNDQNNLTGYSQVIEEGVDDNSNGELDAAEIDKSYTLGLDVIAQHDTTHGNLAFLYDAHGSTRGLTNSAGVLVESYDYDAFGQLLNNATPGQLLTRLLYSGEQTDATGLQYLRGRYYDLAAGRFTRLDPYFGNMNQPLSLHKYLYTNGNPLLNTDPTGLWSLPSMATTVAVGSILTNITLTTIQGVRHGASASVIAWNVSQNLAVFGVIAGSILLGGPIAWIATGVLVATAVKGGAQLYVSWPEMDTVDRSIAIAMIATYSAFGLAIRPAPGTPSVYEGEASVIPESYLGKIAIDMNRAPAESLRNAAGFPRNRTWFWNEVLREKPEWFSKVNVNRIKGEGQPSLSPRVDATWVHSHPEHATFMGDVLVHHHLAQGRFAVPVPQRVHQAYSGVLHPNQ